MERSILINEDGSITFVYDDELATALSSEGDARTKRVSHVEPYGDGWAADMTPIGGGVLGQNGEAAPEPDERGINYINIGARSEPLLPFPTRQAALDAERAWLRNERDL